MELDSEDLGNQVFDWTTKTNEQREYDKIDWEKLQYTTEYNSYYFYQEQFPKGFENIPGFEKIFEAMVEDNVNHTPLAEYNKRTAIKEEEIIISVNINE